RPAVGDGPAAGRRRVLRRHRRRQYRGIARRGRDPRDLIGAAATAARRLGGDQHPTDFLDAGELVDRTHQVALGALFEPAAGQVDVLLLQALDHVLDRQADARQLLDVQVYLDLVLQPAADPDRGHAGHRFQPALEVVVGVAAQFGELAHRIALAL